MFMLIRYAFFYPHTEIGGCLLYVAVVTRPDYVCCGYADMPSAMPTYTSCKEACRVLNYLSHYPAEGIIYTGSMLNFCMSIQIRTGQ